MDPDAALRRINDEDRLNAEAMDAIGNLAEWLQRGGFQPTWANYPTGTKRFRRFYPHLIVESAP